MAEWNVPTVGFRNCYKYVLIQYSNIVIVTYSKHDINTRQERILRSIYCVKFDSVLIRALLSRIKFGKQCFQSSRQVGKHDTAGQYKVAGNPAENIAQLSMAS